MFALALTLHLMQPQIPHLRAPTLLADDAPIARPPVELPALAAPQAAPPDLHVEPKLADPLAGSFSFAEYGLGALGVVVTNVAFGGLAINAGDHNGDTPEVIAFVAAGVLLSPLVASLIAWGMASPTAAGSFGKAFLRAGLVQLGGAALVTAMLFIGQSDVAAAIAAVIFVAVELVGVPIAASLGMHAASASADDAPDASPADSVRNVLPPRASVTLPSQLMVALHF